MTPDVLFLDGEYWGVYMLKAPYESKYLAKEYGVSEEGLNIRKYYYGVYNQSFRNMTDYIISNDMRDAENYEHVKEMMDIDSYLTYVCANIYLANTNFTTTGTSTWKTNEATGTGYSDVKWRWLMDFSADTMSRTRRENYKINTFMLPEVHGDRVFQSLLMNKDFCQRMVEIMEELIKENFSQEKCTEIIDEYEGLLKKPALDSYSRFYGSLPDGEYSKQVDDIREFFAYRAEYIMQYTKDLAEKGGDLVYVAEYEAQKAAEKAKENSDEESLDEMNSSSVEETANEQTSVDSNGNATQENGDNADG